MELFLNFSYAVTKMNMIDPPSLTVFIVVYPCFLILAVHVFHEKILAVQSLSIPVLYLTVKSKFWNGDSNEIRLKELAF